MAQGGREAGGLLGGAGAGAAAVAQATRVGVLGEAAGGRAAGHCAPALPAGHQALARGQP